MLIVLGLALAHHAGPFGGPAWITGGVLLAFAVLGLLAVRRQRP